MTIKGLFDDMHSGEIDPGRYELQDLGNSEKVYGYIFMDVPAHAGKFPVMHVVLFDGYPGLHNVKVAHMVTDPNYTLAIVLDDAKKKNIPHTHDSYEGTAISPPTRP